MPGGVRGGGREAPLYSIVIVQTPNFKKIMIYRILKEVHEKCSGRGN
jgi:hypothetical protein